MNFNFISGGSPDFSARPAARIQLLTRISTDGTPSEGIMPSENEHHLHEEEHGHREGGHHEQETGEHHHHEDKPEHHHHHELKIKLINEDDGRNYEIHGEATTLVAMMIEKVYEKLRVKREKTDRLRCENGEDVYQFHAMHLRAYFEAGHCSDHTWVFAGGTGGA